MMKTQTVFGVGAILAALVLCAWMTWPREVTAHCDALDGPLVLEAKAALAAGDVTPILKWVRPEYEAEIRVAFDKTVAVRSMGAAVAELVDVYLIETLVRLHREGEGAPYTGLKPAGEIEPIVAAADEALVGRSVDDLAGKIGLAADHAIRERFERLIEAQKHKVESVEAGRDYVEAYVEYVHFVEELHSVVAGGSRHH